jgi:hypothetical protein
VLGCGDGNTSHGGHTRPRSKVMKLVTLKNGTTAPKRTVKMTLSVLEILFEEDQVAVYELWELCKNPSYQCCSDSLKFLYQFSLINECGQVDAVTKDVILSTVHGEGPDFYLESPYFE